MRTLVSAATCPWRSPTASSSARVLWAAGAAQRARPAVGHHPEALEVAVVVGPDGRTAASRAANTSARTRGWKNPASRRLNRLVNASTAKPLKSTTEMRRLSAIFRL